MIDSRQPKLQILDATAFIFSQIQNLFPFTYDIQLHLLLYFHNYHTSFLFIEWTIRDYNVKKHRLTQRRPTVRDDLRGWHGFI